MKKLLIILVIFASCKKEQINPIIGEWYLNWGEFEEIYVFNEYDGSHALFEDNVNTQFWEFDYTFDDEWIYIQYDNTKRDTLYYKFWTEKMTINGNEYERVN
ncbi:hypothetical protein [Massilibacteroides sp.]|uniref:hypothetical protein n=1 Tax=Massilibacteroides sp. TaxID=2034766 RepID=UPI002623422B|nr:hypothetical protein [Massilibacteroides sp.]MDD4515672.1 hypothetical protein [Massilibacteroides sp.]